MMRLRAVSAVALGALLFAPSRAEACGAAYPGGPMVCTLEDAPSRKRPLIPVSPPVARVSASWSYTTTTLLLSGDRRTDLTRHAVFAGTELPLGRGLGLRFGAGGILGGELQRRGAGRAELGPGVSGFFGATKTVLEERGALPFVQLGATLSVSRAATRGPVPTDASSFTAFDVRASATAGKSLLSGVLVPYATVRAFGGPIFYAYGGEDGTGTDLYKYQVGGGVSIAVPGQGSTRVLDVFAEGIALGERGLSAGLGTTF